MSNKEISIKKIKAEMTQCRLIQLQKEQEEKAEAEAKTKMPISNDVGNGKKHEE